jgi:glycosyltransferase involved in cell wall biosynthesis
VKVLQVLPALEGGGVERGTLEIARALVEAGHESHVLSAGGRLVPELEAGGSRHHQRDLGRKSPLTARHIWPLRRWLGSESFDLVHARSRMPAWITWLALRGMPENRRPAFVTTVHGLHSVSRYSAIMTRGQRVIVVSASVQEYVNRHYPECEPDRIRLIHRGIDPAEFPHGYRPGGTWLDAWFSDYPQLRDRPVLTLAGRLTRLKNHAALLDILERLIAQGSNACAVIAGGEDPRRRQYAAELRRAIADRGLAERVVCTGHRSDIREIYAVSDVVLSLSSKPESFGRSVLEPLSMGIPVVGFAHGGVGEILGSLFPAGAVPPGDIDGAVAAINRVLQGEAGEPAPNDTFLLSRMCEQTLAVYRELVPYSAG